MEIEEGETLGKFMDLARKLKSLWNMKLTVIPIAVGVIGTLSKNLGNKLRNLDIRVKIKTTAPINHVEYSKEACRWEKNMLIWRYWREKRNS